MPERVNFGKLEEVLNIPDLIGIQLDSYSSFLQKDIPPEKRENRGLQEVFNEVFPIQSLDKKVKLSFLDYKIGTPKKSIIDCLKDGESYTASLYVNFRLSKQGNSIDESVFFGDIPMMTPNGSFVINGAERVVISQLHRSPGICFEKHRHPTGKFLYSYRIIPDRGSWLEVQFDINNNIYIFLDRRKRRRKFLITTFLRAIGYETNKDIIEALHEIKVMTTAQLLKLDQEALADYYTYEPIHDIDGNVVVEPLIQLTESHVESLSKNHVRKVSLAYIPKGDHSNTYKDYIINCLTKDQTYDRKSAAEKIFMTMRPGDPTNLENSLLLIERLCFDRRRYDLGAVGRFKINEHLGLNVPEDVRVLTKEDIVEATKRLIELYHTSGPTDDIDHLGARRVRPVGELLQNHCRIGLLRTDRMIRERMSQQSGNSEQFTSLPSGVIQGIINQKIFISYVRDFFARSQLSQFMDQTNPLSELTNKRRLSALGPGGLSRERAGFEVRDIHSSHYGRICPIETPEGPNIGLISSMSLYAKLNRLGFLETPYRKVEKGVVTNEIVYLTADKEEKYIIAQANAPLKGNKFVNPTVMSRFMGESAEHPKEEVQLMDVSPKQLVSGAAGLIPFLEHDDANRALMGSNMQRQAVPLMVTDSPYVGTGLERKIAIDSRAAVSAIADGIVAEVSDSLIVTTTDGLTQDKTKDPHPQVYNLIKFLRSNSGTCVNQRPIVRSGDVIKKGDPIADGAATSGAELALGKNVRAAYMPWCGYNFEDAIVLSERLVKEDVYTSIHIDEFEVIARETKLGPEEITADLPNIGEDSLRNLDAHGIIRLGTEVKPGDILVGKITPKVEQDLTAEERLLRAIFGEKASDVKDTSLLLPSGKSGIVMDIRIKYAKDNSSNSKSTKAAQKQKFKDAKKNYKTTISDIMSNLTKDFEFLEKQKLPVSVYATEENKETGIMEENIIIMANRKITKPTIGKLVKAIGAWHMEECPVKHQIEEVFSRYQTRYDEACRTYNEVMDASTSDSTISNGPIQSVKIYIASKRKIQVGDKMAGRHGNKGIVSRIVPVEDMPFTSDGKPVDIVLNPLGVPSRMNVGQVLEAHLGWAASMLGIKVATPVFDGVPEEKIINMLRDANKKIEAECGENFHWGFRTITNADGTQEEVFDGKTDLYDGRTGNKFDQRVTVGIVYMLKLDHLVANKIHARSVGPYSLVTQQPLGGKAQHGGQRFGEMEVWALEAYGAAYTLLEMLTVKSDDTAGRSRIYESIVSGKNVLQPGRPESFNVLLKEMQSLGLDVRTVKRSESN